MKQLKIWRHGDQKITSSESASIQKYLKDIDKIPLITIDKEVELAQKIRNWDKKALEDLVNANLRFVVSVAKQYKSQSLSLWDLINEWNLWLYKAAERFDETRWFKFISYAVWWIRQSIISALQESWFKKLPLNRVNDLRKIRSFRNDFFNEYQIDPDYQTIAEALTMKKSEVQNLMESQNKRSLDDSFSNNDDSRDYHAVISDTLLDNPDTSIQTWTQNEQLFDLLSWILTEIELDVLKKKLWIWTDYESTFEDIWNQMWLTRERIRQIYKKSISELRKKWDLFEALVAWDLDASKIWSNFSKRSKIQNSSKSVEKYQHSKLKKHPLNDIKKQEIVLYGHQREALDTTYRILSDRVSWEKVCVKPQEIESAILWRSSMWSGKTIMAWKLIEEYIYGNKKKLEKLGLDLSHLRIVWLSHETWVINRGYEWLYIGDSKTPSIFSKSFQQKTSAHVIHTHSKNQRNINAYWSKDISIIFTTIQSLKSNKYLNPNHQDSILKEAPHLYVYDEGQSLQWLTYGPEIKRRIDNQKLHTWHKSFLLTMTWTPTKRTLQMAWDPIVYRWLSEHIQSDYSPPIKYHFIQSFEWINFNQKIADAKEQIQLESNNFKKRHILSELKKDISEVVPEFPDEEIMVFDMLMRMQRRYEQDWKLGWVIVYCKNIATAKRISVYINDQIKENDFFQWESFLAAPYHHWSSDQVLKSFKDEKIKFIVAINKMNLGHHIPTASNMVFSHDIDSPTIPEQRFSRILSQSNEARYLDYTWVIGRLVNAIWLQEDTANVSSSKIWDWSDSIKSEWKSSKVQISSHWLLAFDNMYTPYSQEMDITSVLKEIMWIESEVLVPKPSWEQIRQDYKEWLFTKHDLNVKNRRKRSMLLNQIYKNEDWSYPNHIISLKIPLWWKKSDSNSIDFILSLIEETEYSAKKPMISSFQAKELFHSWSLDDAFWWMKKVNSDKKFFVPKTWIAVEYRKIAEMTNEITSSYPYRLPMDTTAFIRLVAWKEASSLKHLYQFFYDLWVDTTPYVKNAGQMKDLFNKYLILFCKHQWITVNEDFDIAVEFVFTTQKFKEFALRYNNTYSKSESLKMRSTITSLCYIAWVWKELKELKRRLIWEKKQLLGIEILEDYRNWVLDISQLKDATYYKKYLKIKSMNDKKAWIKRYYPKTRYDMLRLVWRYYWKELDSSIIHKWIQSHKHIKQLFLWKDLEIERKKATLADYSVLVRNGELTEDIINWGRSRWEARAREINKQWKYAFSIHTYYISATSVITWLSRSDIQKWGTTWLRINLLSYRQSLFDNASIDSH